MKPDLTKRLTEQARFYESEEGATLERAGKERVDMPAELYYEAMQAIVTLRSWTYIAALTIVVVVVVIFVQH